MKEILRSLAYQGLVRSGLTRLGRRLADRSGTLILYGHRVSSDDEGYMQGLAPAWLDQQLAYLCRHFEIVPLHVLVDALRAGRPAPSNAVVLTFDDGFRDNYEQAFPLLCKYGVTATIFTVLATTGENRAKSKPLRAANGVKRGSNAGWTWLRILLRILLEFAEKGGYSSYTP